MIFLEQESKCFPLHFSSIIKKISLKTRWTCPSFAYFQRSEFGFLAACKHGNDQPLVKLLIFSSLKTQYLLLSYFFSCWSNSINTAVNLFVNLSVCIFNKESFEVRLLPCSCTVEFRQLYMCTVLFSLAQTHLIM